MDYWADSVPDMTTRPPSILTWTIHKDYKRERLALYRDSAARGLAQHDHVLNLPARHCCLFGHFVFRQYEIYNLSLKGLSGEMLSVRKQLNDIVIAFRNIIGTTFEFFVLRGTSTSILKRAQLLRLYHQNTKHFLWQQRKL